MNKKTAKQESYSSQLIRENTMIEVIELLDSSEDETPPPPTLSRRGASNDDAICIDLDESEKENTSKRPQQQASIESDVSDDEGTEKLVAQIPLPACSNVAAPPAPTTSLDDSDFDSSDDECDLAWLRNRTKQELLKNSQSSIEAVSTKTLQAEIPLVIVEKKPSAMKVSSRKVPAQEPKEQSSTLPLPNSRDIDDSSTGKPRMQSKQAQRAAASDRRQTPRSPGGTNVFEGKARIPTPVRRSLPGSVMKQTTGGMVLSSHGLKSKQKPSNDRTLGIPQIPPPNVVAAREHVAKSTSEEPWTSPRSSGRAASVLERHAALLVGSKPNNKKAPQHQKDNGSAHIMTTNNSNLTSIARKRPIGKGPKKPSPTRKPPAVHGRSQKFTLGTTNKKSKTKSIPDDNNLVALGRTKGGKYSSLNERVRKGATNKPLTSEWSPMKSSLSNGSIPAPGPQHPADAARSEGRPASILKRSPPMPSHQRNLAGKSRVNESDNFRGSKPAPCQPTTLLSQTPKNESENVRLSKVAPMSKRLGQTRPNESDDNDRPKKQVKQISGTVCVDRTEQGETNRASVSTEQAKSVAHKSDFTATIDVESPLPCNKDKSSQDTSSRGSVVSPAENGDSNFDRLPVVSRSIGNETSFETSPNAKDESVLKTLSAKQAERLTPVYCNPKQSNESGDLAILDSGSSEFSQSSDSDSETGGSSEVVTGSESLLHDSVSADDGQKLWRRRTANRVNYSEPSDDIEMTDSQSYLDSTPKTKPQENASKSNEWIPVPFVKRTSKRKREVLSGSYSDSVRRPEPASPAAVEGDDIVKECATPIEHLSKYTYDEQGLPTHEFSVLAADDTIYDLKVQVKKSGIPGAGHGAFLTFKGARVLKGGLRETAAKKKEACVLYEPETMQPLEAVAPDGCGVSVSLTGKNLHGNRNLHFLPLTLTPLDAIIPTDTGSKRINVKLSGDHLHYEDSDDEEEPLCFSMSPKRLGHLGIHTAKDYVLDPSIELNSFDFSVELGRYGPVLKSDRYREPDYDVKNYLFSDAPAEYAFGVDEEFAGCKQVIDITDDATGTRHEEALRLPMSYINECGHSPNLKANVQIREKNDRSVYYYLTLPEALKNGETIELLADYDESYESVRERKGYGKANIENGLKGDDHEPTALKRNFEERDFLVKLIDDLGTVGTFHLTEFVFSNIFEPLDGVIRKYLTADGDSSPTCLQWVARLRLNWLADVLLSRIPHLLQEPSWELPESTNDNLLDQVRKWAEQMKWRSCSECLDVLVKRDATAALEALRLASRSELFYKLSGTIVKPLDEEMWCPLAVELIQHLSDGTALYLCSNNENRDDVLIQSYLQHAKKASEEIIIAACCNQRDSGTALSKLKFVSSVAKDEIVDESTLKSFEGFKDRTFFSKNTTFRKGILACLLEVQAYRDSIELADIPKQSGLKIVPHQAKSHEVVIIDGSRVAESGGSSVYGYPRHLDSVVKCGRVNKDWYLLWQVLYIVNCFSEEFLGKKRNGEDILSLERLCNHIGVDHAKAQAVVDMGIDMKEYSITFVGQKATSRPKKRAPRQHAPRQAATKRSTGPVINRSLFDGIVWKALVGLGWKLEVGTRPTDHYFLPPGVFRRRGWSNRKDYWDSVKLVMSHIRTDSKWKDVPEVAAALDLFDKLAKFQSTVKLPKKIDVDELIRQYKESCASS